MSEEPPFEMALDDRAVFQTLSQNNGQLISVLNTLRSCNLLLPDQEKLIVSYMAHNDEQILRLVEKALRTKKLSKKTVRSPRQEHRDNIERLHQYLLGYACAMLGTKDPERLRIMRRQISTGRFIAQQLKIREATIGRLLNLRGKNEKPDAIAQCFYEICRDAEHFALFREFAACHPIKSSDSPADIFSHIFSHR